MKYTESSKLTILSGGVGGAKLIDGISGVANPENITIISNTADDIDIRGLRISPDVDIVLYTLAGIIDPERGWGIKDDTFTGLDLLKSLGEDTWFRLGDKDISTHIFRTHLLNNGLTPTHVTGILCDRFKVKSKVLPMTDSFVHTEVETSKGWMHFQDFLIKYRNQLDVIDVKLCMPGQDPRNASQTNTIFPTEDVRAGIINSEAIIICPSNPIASIGPILRLEGIRELIENRNVPCIVVSPLISGKSLKGPADKMIRAAGFEPNAAGVAQFYEGLIDGIIIDRADTDLETQISDMGITVHVTDTVMSTQDKKRGLAKEVRKMLNKISYHGHLTTLTR